MSGEGRVYAAARVKYHAAAASLTIIARGEANVF
jgi:hypothetical protein